MDLRETGWTEFIWFRIGIDGWLLLTRWWISGIYERQGISWQVRWLSACQGLCSVSIVEVIKSTRMRSAGHTAWKGKIRNFYEIMLWKTEGKRPLGRPWHGWEGKIKRDLKLVGCECGLNSSGSCEHGNEPSAFQEGPCSTGPSSVALEGMRALLSNGIWFTESRFCLSQSTGCWSPAAHRVGGCVKYNCVQQISGGLLIGSLSLSVPRPARLESCDPNCS
jgi:hypothetical protein